VTRYSGEAARFISATVHHLAGPAKIVVVYLVK